MFKYILFFYFFISNVCFSVEETEKLRSVDSDTAKINTSNSVYLGIGLNGAINTIDHNSYSASSPFTLAPSVFVGFRHNFKNNLMIGFEFDANFISLKQSNYYVSSKVSNIMNFSGLIGYNLLENKITPFVSFGPSLASYDADSGDITAYGTMPGLKVGTGVDVKIHKQIALRLEYSYNHFWTNYYIPSYYYISYVSVQSLIQNFRIGVAYSFDL
ncbi:MAG: outer membrane protein beta-barrel domain [Pseudomonadota bacterium]|jgi:opacity protein-like surface antigen